MESSAHLFSPWYRVAVAAVVLGTAHAQSVAPTPTNPPGKASAGDEPISLSPFVVTTDKDNGYIAADTLNAGRLRTNLLMIQRTRMTDNFTDFFLDSHHVIQLCMRYAPTDLKWHRQWFARLPEHHTSLQQVTGWQ